MILANTVEVIDSFVVFKRVMIVQLLQLISLGELVGAIIVAPNGLGRILEARMAFCGGQPSLYLQIYLLEFSTFRFR